MLFRTLFKRSWGRGQSCGRRKYGRAHPGRVFALTVLQALLHLLLKLSESVTRLESLLLIASPEQDDIQQSPLDDSRPAHLNLTEESVDDRFVKARVSIEFVLSV